MATKGISDDELINQISLVFRRFGYDGASLSKIAQATGLGRASLYHRFPSGKPEMADAVMRRSAEWLQRHALDPLKGSGSAKDRIEAMGASLTTFYHGGKTACLLDTLSLGEDDAPGRTLVRSTVRRWRDTLTRTLVKEGIPQGDARLRAEGAIIEIQGSLILARALGNPKPFRRVIEALPGSLLAPVL